MTPEHFEAVLGSALDCLRGVETKDWTTPAGTLEWTCAETVAHIIDCLFSYSLQVAAHVQTEFVPLQELRALPEASPPDLLSGLEGMAVLFTAALRSTPLKSKASDGVVLLDRSDWCARGAYEVALHTFDVTSSFDAPFALDATLCEEIMASEGLWMFERRRADGTMGAWERLLRGSGRE